MKQYCLWTRNSILSGFKTGIMNGTDLIPLPVLGDQWELASVLDISVKYEWVIVKPLPAPNSLRRFGFGFLRLKKEC